MNPSLQGRGDTTPDCNGSQHNGVAVNRYTLSGPLFGAGGALAVDARDHRLTEARIARPNHPGYKDFQQILLGSERASEADWRLELRRHFEGC